MYKKMIRCFTAAIAVCLLLGMYIPLRAYFEVDAVLYRAQRGAEAEDTFQALDSLVKNMHSIGMTQGHVFPLFGSDKSDIGLDYQTLVRIRDGVGEKVNQPHDATYEQAMTRYDRQLDTIVLDAVWFALWRDWPILLAIVIFSIMGWAIQRVAHLE